MSAVRLFARGLLLATLLWLAPWPASAAPGLCIGPVCADEITRSDRHPAQLRLRLSDQQGHLARITVDCRNGQLSPPAPAIEPGYAQAVARKACRLS